MLHAALSWPLSFSQRICHGLRILWSQLTVEPPYPIISWRDKTVIVTGASSGLGLEAARHFVRLGAKRVILAVRSPEKGTAAKNSIEQSTRQPHDVAEVWKLDLCSFESVKSFAREARKLPRLDAVVHNAGIATPRFRLAERNEETITTNVISTFLLALLLLPKMKDTARKYHTRPHLSVVSSAVIFYTSFPEAKAQRIFDRLNDQNSARMLDRYNVSKLIEAMACREIYAMHPDDYPVVVNYVNPGLCYSDLLREAPFPASVLPKVLGRTSEVGSRTLVHAASAGPESHGQYLSDARIEDPPSLLLTKEGTEMQWRVWSELMDKLEAIEPGILRNL